MKRASVIVISACSILTAAAAPEADRAGAESAGIYRLPFADGTNVQVFDDFTTHRPRGRVDLFATGGHPPYRVVAEVGDQVAAGAYLGEEGAVGCAMLNHVHFEVAVPDSTKPIDAGGFLLKNEDGKRERNPRFCGVPNGGVKKDATYRAVSC